MFKSGIIYTMILIAALTGSCTINSTTIPATAKLVQARTKIKHVIIIMQENRSFDHYFGTFPGADGIPMKNNVPTVCSLNPNTGICDKPFHDPNDHNHGGPHMEKSAAQDINGGKMDGFVATMLQSQHGNCINPTDPNCTTGGQKPDVMGWHDAREIPNYWAYAQNFVLQDHMFEPTTSWSLPSHLFMVSGWSAICTDPKDPMSCISNNNVGTKKGTNQNKFAWTDLTYLLYKNNIRWAYYLSKGVEPDCPDGSMSCLPQKLNLAVPGIWNPLPNFTTVHQDNQLQNIQDISNYYLASQNGTLPAVSWIVPEGSISEHPPASVFSGQAYVTRLINAAMQGPNWDSTAIFLAWDDWGGFYDHIVPPTVDNMGYGLRVPGLVISPYAKKSYIDHQTLSFDAYLKLIEDLFLNGQRIDPKTDGRPDLRPTIRENLPILGDLINDFDFNQSPRPAFILPINPPPGPASIPGN